MTNRRFDWDRIPNDTTAEFAAGLDSQVGRESNLAIAVGSLRISGSPGDMNNFPSCFRTGPGGGKPADRR
jgi:hypothetical protein